MIGDMISRIRTERKMTKTELAKLAGVNIGHITHIEKGERNPSHKTLRKICIALDIPYQQLMYTYDRELNEDQEEYGIVNHISYNKIPAVDNINEFIDCPSKFSNASLAFKMPDCSMEPQIKAGEYLFVELNSLLDNNEIGVFKFKNTILVRKINYKSGKIILTPLNKKFETLKLDIDCEFYIIGKILK